ncbi:MAG: flavin reductase family protein [Pseudomonadota bacterium]
MPESTRKPREEDAAAYRCALGQFPTGVCIVSSPGCVEHPAPFAITVSSFVSVSLEPRLISWCIQHGSSSYSLWMASQNFSVSVLAADQAALCEHYARKGRHAIADDDRFQTTLAGNPAVRDACATFDARNVATHEAGDHTIIVAEVVDFDAAPDRPALIYHQGVTRAST